MSYLAVSSCSVSRHIAYGGMPSHIISCHAVLCLSIGIIVPGRAIPRSKVHGEGRRPISYRVSGSRVV